MLLLKHLLNLTMTMTVIGIAVSTCLPAAEFVLCDSVVDMSGGFWDDGQVMDFHANHLNPDRPHNLLEPIDYIKNGSLYIRMEMPELTIPKEGTFKSVRIWHGGDYAGAFKTPMFYGLKLTFNGPGIQERHLPFKNIRNRFTTHPRDAWRTGIHRLGFKDYSKEHLFQSAAPFKVHLTVIVSDESSVRSVTEGYGGVTAKDLQAVPKIARLWRIGSLGQCAQAARKIGKEHDHAELANQILQAVEQHTDSTMKTITELSTTAPLRAYESTQELLRQLGSHPRSREVKKIGRELQKTPEVKSEIAARALQMKIIEELERLRPQVERLENLQGNDLTKAATLLRGLRLLKKKHENSAAWKNSQAMITSLGLTDHIAEE